MKKIISIITPALLFVSIQLFCSEKPNALIESYTSKDNSKEKSHVSVLNTLQQAATTSYQVAAPIVYATSVSIIKTSSNFVQGTVVPFIQSKLSSHNNYSEDFANTSYKQKGDVDNDADADIDEHADFCVVPSEEERLSYFYDEETLQSNLNADATTTMFQFGQAIETFFSENPEDIKTQRRISAIFELAQKVNHQGNAFVLAQITAKTHRERQKEILKKTVFQHADLTHKKTEELDSAITELRRQRDEEIERIKNKCNRQEIILTQKYNTQLKQVCAEIKTVAENLVYIDHCSGNETSNKKLCDPKNYSDLESCKNFLAGIHQKKAKNNDISTTQL